MISLFKDHPIFKIFSLKLGGSIGVRFDAEFSTYYF